MKTKRNTTNRRGVALLVVLFIVMTITILSLGFLSRSDVELACGRNMILRTQMDYLAESGLEHARGLILNPQDVNSEYWAGDVRRQLVAGSDDYYDVMIVRDDPNLCNYFITCDAYREKSGEKTGRGGLEAELRLDPCIALWTGRDTTVSSAVIINGDVYCNGTLTNNGVINGDAFANGLGGSESIAGQQKTAGDLSLAWPRVTVEDFTSNYPVQIIDANSLSGETLGPYNPARICYHNGDLELAGGVQIEGMLIVDANLTITGNGNVITAGKSVPALLVTGDVIIEDDSKLDVYGLAVVEGQMQISASAVGVSILGGLFVDDGIVETTADASGNGNKGTLHNEPTWRPSGGHVGGALEFDGSNEYITLSSPVSVGKIWTVIVWINPNTSSGGWDTVLGMDGAHSLYNYNGKWTVYDMGAGGIISQNGNLTVGSWQQVAAVSRGDGGIDLYHNGPLDGGTDTGTATDWSFSYIAARSGPSEYFDGLIDDVRIYNRALDANDIYPIPSEVGLVGHWKLDEEGTSNINITAAPAKTAIVVWSEAGVAEKWGQAAGAFFRSIERK